MRRFYAAPDQFNEGIVTLDGEEVRHLRDVLRLRTGDEVRVFDGAGREFACRIESIRKRDAELAVINEVEPASPESALDLTLAAALLKGEKFELVVQKAVELGVNTLIPLQTVRCDVKPGNAEKRLERWRKIALEAAKQSGRARLMKIGEIAELKSVLDPGCVLFSERDGKSFSEVGEGKKITAIVGPEGGWDDSELKAAESSGCKIVTLGGRIMRAETAAISITAILQHRFGDIN